MKEKQRKKFHWWYIPLGIVLVLVLTAGGLVLWMHSMLPWPNMVAMTSNFQMELSDPMRAYVVGEVLALQDGTGVETPEDMALRRAEVLDLFEKHVYGVLPKNGFETSFEVVEEGEALDGAALRRQVKLTVTTDKGSSDALLLMYLPNSDRPAPVVVGLNFNGNHTVLDDPAILPSYASEKDAAVLEEERGGKAERWAIEEAVARGYGVATIWCNDFAPDDAKAYSSRVISLFDEPEFKAVGGFDEHYFMYVEDADLTQKMRTTGKAYLVPQYTAIHAWHRAAHRSLKPFLWQTGSLLRYFHKWGFKF